LISVYESNESIEIKYPKQLSENLQHIPSPKTKVVATQHKILKSVHDSKENFHERQQIFSQTPTDSLALFPPHVNHNE
jgi:hypothetical protein